MADLSLHDQAPPAFDPFVIESAPAEVLLDQLVHVADRIKHYTRWKQLLNDALTLRHELGQLADSQEHDGCLIFYSAGRLTAATLITDTWLNVDSIYTQVVPNSRSEVASVDQQPSAIR